MVIKKESKYSNEKDRTSEQNEHYLAFARPYWDKYVADEDGKYTVNNMRMLLMSYEVYNDFFGTVINGNYINSIVLKNKIILFFFTNFSIDNFRIHDLGWCEYSQLCTVH